MTAADKMNAKIAACTTEQLCLLFEQTNETQRSPELAIVRRFIMDHLEARDAEAFLTWIDTDDVLLMDHPAIFFGIA